MSVIAEYIERLIMQNFEQYQSLPEEIRKLFENNKEKMDHFVNNGLTIKHIQYFGVEGLKILLRYRADALVNLMAEVKVTFNDLMVIDKKKAYAILENFLEASDLIICIAVSLTDLAKVDYNKLSIILRYSANTIYLLQDAKILFTALVDLPEGKLQLILVNWQGVKSILEKNPNLTLADIANQSTANLERAQLYPFWNVSSPTYTARTESRKETADDNIVISSQLSPDVFNNNTRGFTDVSKKLKNIKTRQEVDAVDTSPVATSSNRNKR